MSEINLSLGKNSNSNTEVCLGSATDLVGKGFNMLWFSDQVTNTAG
jgi:hypothetical protein